MYHEKIKTPSNSGIASTVVPMAQIVPLVQPKPRRLGPLSPPPDFAFPHGAMVGGIPVAEVGFAQGALVPSCGRGRVVGVPEID